ncbi:MAG TPA: STAS domain-containing protein [Pseudonocardia sp.]
MRTDDDSTILVVTGEIDIASIGDFQAALDSATSDATSDRGGIVVDLSSTEFIDSSGIGALYENRERLKAVLCAPESEVARALTLSGLDMLVLIDSPRP